MFGEKGLQSMCTAVLTYGAKTSTVTNITTKKFRTSQRAMERSVLGMYLRETKVTDGIEKNSCL